MNPKRFINKTIRNFFIKIIRSFRLHQAIFEIQEAESIKKCNNAVINNGGTFYREAAVYNLQNNPQQIIIGKGTHIRGHLQIFKYGGSIKIGNDSYVGDHSRIWSGEKVIVGNYVQISHNVNIIDTSAHEYDAIERAERYIDLIKNGHWQNKGNVLTAPVIIGDYAWISLNVTILRGVTIGEGAIIGANAVVTKDIPPYTLAIGNPAKVVKQLINTID
jgi:acetyltransferase-like isoleucine patch superfamily enzyme